MICGTCGMGACDGVACVLVEQTRARRTVEATTPTPPPLSDPENRWFFAKDELNEKTLETLRAFFAGFADAKRAKPHEPTYGWAMLTVRLLDALTAERAASRAAEERLHALEEVARRAESLLLARDEDMSPKDEHAKKLGDAIDALRDVETVEQTLARQAADYAEHIVDRKRATMEDR